MEENRTEDEGPDGGAKSGYSPPAAIRLAGLDGALGLCGGPGSGDSDCEPMGNDAWSDCFTGEGFLD